MRKSVLALGGIFLLSGCAAAPNYPDLPVTMSGTELLAQLQGKTCHGTHLSGTVGTNAAKFVTQPDGTKWIDWTVNGFDNGLLPVQLTSTEIVYEGRQGAIIHLHGDGHQLAGYNQIGGKYFMTCEAV